MLLLLKTAKARRATTAMPRGIARIRKAAIGSKTRFLFRNLCVGAPVFEIAPGNAYSRLDRAKIKSYRDRHLLRAAD
jgi:hypothetical protein